MINTHSKGFTLIELMVVISIIALFSSIGLFTYADARTKANDSKKKAETNQVEKAIILFKDTKGYVPPNYTGTTPLSVATEGSTAYNQSMQELVNAGYLSSVPKSSDGTYVYYSDSATQPQTATFGARLKSTASASINKSSCAGIVPALSYSQCWKTLDVPGGTQNLTVFNEATFCNQYGDSTCYTGANGQFASLCRSKPQTFYSCPNPSDLSCPGSEIVSTSCLTTLEGFYTISCVVPTGNGTICSGGNNDYCSCVQ